MRPIIRGFILVVLISAFLPGVVSLIQPISVSGHNEFGGCTTFAAIGSATQDGRPIVLQNIDEAYSFRGEVCTISDPRYYRFMAVNLTRTSNASITNVYHGMNEKGLALATTNVPTSKSSTRGWKFDQHVIEILRRASTPEEAYRILTLNLNLHGYNGWGRTWIFCNASHVVAAENANVTVAILKSFTDGFVVETQHFNALTEYNTMRYKQVTEDSMIRFERTNELIQKSYGKLNLDVVKEIATDRKNNLAAAICNSGDRDQNGNPMGTLASTIMLPSSVEPAMWTALGSPPCMNEYTLRTIKSSPAPTTTGAAIATPMIISVKAKTTLTA